MTQPVDALAVPPLRELASGASCLAFGPFELDVRARRLRRGDDVLPVSPRAFEILSMLAARPGEMVTKAELMEKVWPDVIVEEANLAQHVSQLRRVLGDVAKQPIYIATLPRLGYQFVADVRPLPPAPEPMAPPVAPRGRWTFPIAAMVLVAGLAGVYAWFSRGATDPAPLAASARLAFERGQFLFAQGNPDSTELARDAFAEAVAEDPGFAQAQAALASAYVALYLSRKIARADALEHARRAAAAALSLDDGLAEAHTAQGAILLQLETEPARAQAELRRARDLDPASVAALDLLARALRQDGQFDESIEVARQALALDATSVRAHLNLVQSLYFAGRDLGQAARLCDEAYELDRGSVLVLELAADVAEASGRLDDAIDFRARAERLRNQAALADELEATYRSRGFAAANTAYLEAKLAALRRGHPDDVSTAFEQGRLLARLGRIDDAFAAFDAGVHADFSIGVAALRHNPAYRAIRADPRFEALVQRTRLQ